jgi:hypothetical protein
MARLAQLYRNGILRPGWGCGQGSSASRLSRSRAAACRSRAGRVGRSPSTAASPGRRAARSGPPCPAVRAPMTRSTGPDIAGPVRCAEHAEPPAGIERPRPTHTVVGERNVQLASIHQVEDRRPCLIRVPVRERPARRAVRSCSRGGRCPGAARSARPGRALADRRTSRRGGIVFAFCDADAVQQDLTSQACFSSSEAPSGSMQKKRRTDGFRLLALSAGYACGLESPFLRRMHSVSSQIRRRE